MNLALLSMLTTLKKSKQNRHAMTVNEVAPGYRIIVIIETAIIIPWDIYPIYTGKPRVSSSTMFVADYTLTEGINIDGLLELKILSDNFFPRSYCSLLLGQFGLFWAGRVLIHVLLHLTLQRDLIGVSLRNGIETQSINKNERNRSWVDDKSQRTSCYLYTNTHGYETRLLLLSRKESSPVKSLAIFMSNKNTIIWQ